jgi:ABC-type multidrug transport system ATPase subunit
VLTAHQLGVGVAGKRLLTGVELEVGRGEIMALVGPSGLGKTTLLRTLVGLIDPLEGTIELDGRSPDEMGWPRFRRHVMLVAQRPVLFDGTVADNLERPFSYAVTEAAFDAGRAKELLEALHMGDSFDAEARTLSEGQGQRVALVRALLLAPDVLVLDEPTSALDATNRERVEGLLRERGETVVMVSHDPAQVDRVADTELDLTAYAGVG